MDARIRRGILAHENTRKQLSTDTRLESNWQQHAFPAARAVAIPSTVFKEEHKLYANDTTMMLKHYPPAHSDSDISVHFTAGRHFSYRRHFLESHSPLHRRRKGQVLPGANRLCCFVPGRLKNPRRVTKSGSVLVRPKSHCHDVRAGALD